MCVSAASARGTGYLDWPGAAAGVDRRGRGGALPDGEAQPAAALRDAARAGSVGGDVTHRRDRMDGSPARSVEPDLAENPHVQALVDAFAACGDNRTLLLRFLRDLYVAQDLLAAADRWAAARSLLNGVAQADAAEAAGLSVQTVLAIAARVAGPFSTGGCREVEARLQALSVRGAAGGLSRGVRSSRSS